ncbi:MAG: YbdD/YjiX family protein [Beijerinckiaceae bacterium]
MSAAVRTLGRAARGIRWYVESVMGDRAYPAYLEHQRATHPERPPLGPREFWAERYRAQDDDPGSRCC